MNENQNIEWKRIWKDEYLKWISGFANAHGGTLYIGIDDDGKVIGLDTAKKLLEDLPNKIQNRLGIVCDVTLMDKSGKQVIAIKVYPSDIPVSYEGKYYYRSGSTKQELKGQALFKFLLKKSGKTWDDIIEPSARKNDIDSKSIRKFTQMAANCGRLEKFDNETDEIILRNLFLTENSRYKRAAILLFGKRTISFYRNAFVKIGRFSLSADNLIAQDILEGNLIELPDKIIEVLYTKYLVSQIDYEGIYRRESGEIPQQALREVIINALAHKDYSGIAPIQISIYDDKLIVWNEGELEHLSIEDLKRPHPSLPRNPLIAGVFFKAGLIESWGRGTLKVINACKQAGLPEPQFELIGGGFQVTLYKNLYDETYLAKRGLNPRQIRAVLFLKANRKISNKDYQQINNVSKATATRDLKELVEEFRLIEKIGNRGAGIYYQLIGS